MENPPQEKVEPVKRKHYIERAPLGAAGSEDERKRKLGATMSFLVTWPSMEVLPFKIGCPLMAGAAMIPGYMINKTFRKALVMGRSGGMSSYFITTAVPAFVAGSFHYTAITQSILSQDVIECPVCLQVKGGLIQLVCGFVYPLILTPIMNFSIASKLKNLYVPKIHKEPKTLLHFISELYDSKLRTKLWYIAGFQVILGMGMSYFEQDCFANVLLPVVRGERKVSKETHKIELYPDRGY